MSLCVCVCACVACMCRVHACTFVHVSRVCVPEDAEWGVKGTESCALRSCSLSFLMVRDLICSSRRLFSTCSWCRDFNMATTERDTKAHRHMERVSE